eukprot:768749-Hanusia_phi.AAC.7
MKLHGGDPNCFPTSCQPTPSDRHVVYRGHKGGGFNFGCLLGWVINKSSGEPAGVVIRGKVRGSIDRE